MKRLEKLLQEVTEILEDAPEEYECESDEEVDVYAEMQNLKEALETYLE